MGQRLCMRSCCCGCSASPFLMCVSVGVSVSVASGLFVGEVKKDGEGMHSIYTGFCRVCQERFVYLFVCLFACLCVPPAAFNGFLSTYDIPS